MKDDDFELIAETENLIVWRSADDVLGNVYHLELGNLTLHLVSEEWDELVTLFKSI